MHRTAFAALLLFAAVARADELLLQDGRTVTGVVTVSGTRGVSVRTPTGISFYDAHEISAADFKRFGLKPAPPIARSLHVQKSAPATKASNSPPVVRMTPEEAMLKYRAEAIAEYERKFEHSELPVEDQQTTVAAKPIVPRTAKVENSAWDGSVSQVKRHLESVLNDADSVKYVEWSPVVETAAGWMVRCKFRAKNGFGAYVLNNYLFRLDGAGKVVSMADVDG